MGKISLDINELQDDIIKSSFLLTTSIFELHLDIERNIRHYFRKNNINDTKKNLDIVLKGFPEKLIKHYFGFIDITDFCLTCGDMYYHNKCSCNLKY